MSELSSFRLYLLRAMYLYIVLGLAIFKWPEILNLPANAAPMDTVVSSVLGAVLLLSLLGIRYPIKMLPLLFFELLWKSIWVLTWGLPLWSAGQLTPVTQDTLIACLMGVVLVPIVMPWRYVLKQYMLSPGDPWRTQTNSIPSKRPASSPDRAKMTSRL
jgi:hypothetical protein